MNWQEWVVGLLIVLCVARILYGIYLFFRRVKENDNPCASCASEIGRASCRERV